MLNLRKRTLQSHQLVDFLFFIFSVILVLLFQLNPEGEGGKNSRRQVTLPKGTCRTHLKACHIGKQPIRAELVFCPANRSRACVFFQPIGAECMFSPANRSRACVLSCPVGAECLFGHNQSAGAKWCCHCNLFSV